MSSRNGAARADVDTGLFDDVKVRRLARLQQDGPKTLATMSLYVATVLESWAEDRPVPASDASPAWMLGDVAPMIVDLCAVDLLDDDECVPRDTLDRWMGPVRARIAGGHRGAAKRWSVNGQPMGTQSPEQLVQPTRKRAGTPERPRARSREDDDDPRSLKEILRATTGEPDIVKEPT